MTTTVPHGGPDPFGDGSFPPAGPLARWLASGADAALAERLPPGEVIEFRVAGLAGGRPAVVAGTSGRLLVLRRRPLGRPRVAAYAFSELGSASFAAGGVWGTLTLRPRGEAPVPLTLRAADIPPLLARIRAGARRARGARAAT